MTPLWLCLCLFFTYFFTAYGLSLEKTYNDGDSKAKVVENEEPSTSDLEDLDRLALEKTYNDDDSKEKVVENEEPSTSGLEDLDSNLDEFSGLLNRALWDAVPKENLDETLITKKLPVQSTIKKVNATVSNILKTDPLNSVNIFKSFIKPIFGDSMLRRKRQNNVPLQSSEPSNDNANLPINRLLDVTDQLFNRTAFIREMSNREETNSRKQNDKVDVSNRDLNDDQLVPSYRDSFAAENDQKDSSLQVDNSNSPSIPPPDSTEQSPKNQEEDRTIAVENRNFLPGKLLGLFVHKDNKEMKVRGDGPLVTSGLSLIAKILDVGLNILRKIDGNRNLNAKVFAASAITAFTLAVSVSATRAFYIGYDGFARMCRFIIGNSNCDIFQPSSEFPKILKNPFTRVSNLFSFGKGLLKFPKVLFNSARD